MRWQRAPSCETKWCFFPRRVSVAQCVVGQARGFVTPEVFQLLARRVNSVGVAARGAQATFFRLGLHDAVPTTSSPRLNAAIRHFHSVVSVQFEHGDPVLPRNNCSFPSADRACSFWAPKYLHQMTRVSRCLGDVLAHETRVGIQFSYFVRWRPDAAFLVTPHVTPGCWTKNAIIFQKKECRGKFNAASSRFAGAMDQAFAVPRRHFAWLESVHATWRSCASLAQMRVACRYTVPDPVCRRDMPRRHALQNHPDVSYIANESYGDFPTECYVVHTLLSHAPVADVRFAFFGHGRFLRSDGTNRYF